MNAHVTPNGPGAVAGAPDLPPGFRETFVSRFVDTPALRTHAVIGGEGPPLLLIHGWPQTWYAWRLVMPELARDFEVIAIDQRGIGLSDKPHDGYDLTTLAADAAAVMDALGHERFAVYGTDTGMPIAYALAADFPDRVDRIAVSESLMPGVSQSPPLFVPGILNARLWHLMFNQLPGEVNEALVTGRESVFFGSEFEASAGSQKLPEEVVAYYVDRLSDTDALRGSFGFYRALEVSGPQNDVRKAKPLTIPVLAIGGAESAGGLVGVTMELVADDVDTVVLDGTGHWVAEQAPELLADALGVFLAPYRQRELAGHGASTQ